MASSRSHRAPARRRVQLASVCAAVGAHMCGSADAFQAAASMNAFGGINVASVASLKNTPIIPPGTMIEFGGGISPRSFAYAPSRHALLLTDWTQPQVEDDSLMGRLFGWKKKGASRAFLFTPAGKLIRRLDFPGKEATPYGIAEDVDGRIAITFYTLGKDAIEVWDSSLDTKLTFHEQSVRPSMPFFDPSGNGVLWLPYTITDRQYEEGEGVLALWGYNRDGTRWEVFPRREFNRVKYPHTAVMDGHRRLWIAGLGEWIWDLYGFYGPMYRKDLKPQEPYARIEVYETVFDRRHPAWIKEARARYNETNPNAHVPEGQAPPGVDFKAAVSLLRSYPFPFNCLWPIFDITPDGYVLATCYESDTVVIMRVTSQVNGNAGVDPMETLLDAPVPVATLRKPYGFTSIVSIRTDPSGKAITIADRVSARLVSVQWPIPGITTALSAVPEPFADVQHAASNTGLFGPLFVGELPKTNTVKANLV